MTGPAVTTGEAARALGVGLSTLQRWAHDGLVTPAFRTPGGHFRWDVGALREQLRALNPTGESMIDPAAPIRPPIVAAIVTSNRGVLITRRHDGRPLWGFPSGEAEPGESPADTGIREVKEETGLLVKASHVIGERNPHPQTQRHMIYLACRPYQGTDVHVGDEAELAEVVWVGLGTAVERMPTMFGPVKAHLAMALGSGG